MRPRRSRGAVAADRDGAARARRQKISRQRVAAPSLTHCARMVDLPQIAVKREPRVGGLRTPAAAAAQNRTRRGQRDAAIHALDSERLRQGCCHDENEQSTPPVPHRPGSSAVHAARPSPTATDTGHRPARATHPRHRHRSRSSQHFLRPWAKRDARDRAACRRLPHAHRPDDGDPRQPRRPGQAPGRAAQLPLAPARGARAAAREQPRAGRGAQGDPRAARSSRMRSRAGWPRSSRRSARPTREQRRDARRAQERVEQLRETDEAIAENLNSVGDGDEARQPELRHQHGGARADARQHRRRATRSSSASCTARAPLHDDAGDRDLPVDRGAGRGGRGRVPAAESGDSKMQPRTRSAKRTRSKTQV